MATCTKQKARTSNKPKPLDPSEAEALRTGEADPDTAGRVLLNTDFFDGGAELRRVWRAHRKNLLRDWRRIGHRRPYWIESFIKQSPPNEREPR